MRGTQTGASLVLFHDVSSWGRISTWTSSGEDLPPRVGRDAFHRVPFFREAHAPWIRRQKWDAVERVPTNSWRIAVSRFTLNATGKQLKRGPLRPCLENEGS